MKNYRMKMGFILLAFMLVSGIVFPAIKPFSEKIGPGLKKLMSSSEDSKFTVYIFLKDKGPDVQKYLSNPLSLVSQRSLYRRAKVLPAYKLVDYTDVPLYNLYVNSISKKTIKIRHELKWFNCVSAEVSVQNLKELVKLNFITEVELVERYKVMPESTELLKASYSPSPVFRYNPNVDSLDYGSWGATQDTMIKVNRVHNDGIFGQGIIIANFDGGFSKIDHEVFSILPTVIWKKRDFVEGFPDSVGASPHGLATFSLIGGYNPGSLIGPAFRSVYVLCRTENESSETPSEMDNWSAAAQWADSLGVDIITSSIGYVTFDVPYTSYTWRDMNGKNMLISRAATLASRKGIIVCNAAGNSGDSTHNTLGGPADADSIITVGAVTGTGIRAPYSSVGPTTDSINNIPAPRIKPDVMAMGTHNWVASEGGYNNFGSGTSWSCPMVAGVAALMLSANKNLTPIQVRALMTKFGSNSSTPNKLMGWGIVNAKSSVDSARKMDNVVPVIIHTLPFTATTNTGALTFKARIFDNGIIRGTRTDEAPRIYYRKNSGSGWSAYSSANFNEVSIDTFSFQIPGSALNTQVEYYFAAQDIALPNALISTLPSGGSGINPPGTTSPPVRFSFLVANPSGISGNEEKPNRFGLYSNYPNPFNPTTNIKFDIAKLSIVKIVVYDVLGKEVRTLVNESLNQGSYKISFDGTSLYSGVYFYKISAGDYSDVRKMLLIK
ncbi:MAG: S8 family peptidase [Ignavibacteriae bacterium]|nr:S8 family peptidase [Ignavibacteriota bacterium]